MIIEKDKRLVIGIMICALATFIGPAIGGFVLGIGLIFLVVLTFIFEFIVALPESFLSDFRIKNITLSELNSLLLFPFLFAFSGYIVGIVPAFFSSFFVAIHSAIKGEITLKICWLHTIWVIALYAVILFASATWSITLQTVILFFVFTGCGLVSSYLLLKWFPGILYELRFIKSKSGVTP